MNRVLVMQGIILHKLDRITLFLTAPGFSSVAVDYSLCGHEPSTPEVPEAAVFQSSADWEVRGCLWGSVPQDRWSSQAAHASWRVETVSAALFPPCWRRGNELHTAIYVRTTCKPCLWCSQCWWQKVSPLRFFYGKKEVCLNFSLVVKIFWGRFLVNIRHINTIQFQFVGINSHVWKKQPYEGKTKQKFQKTLLLGHSISDIWGGLLYQQQFQ